MKTYLHLSALLLLLMVTSCQKMPTPTASFRLSKDEYLAGDTIILTNTSTNAHSYVWTLFNDTTLTQFTTYNAYYVVPNNTVFEKLTVILNAYSERGKKSNTFTKDIFCTLKPYNSYTFPTDQTSIIQNGNNWVLHYGNYDTYFYTPLDKEASGVYTIPPTANEKVLVKYASSPTPFYSTAGRVILTVHDHKVHAIIDNVELISGSTAMRPNVQYFATY